MASITTTVYINELVDTDSEHGGILSHGEKQFVVTPRIGETIVVADDAGRNNVKYRVVDVLHHLDHFEDRENDHHVTFTEISIIKLY